MFCLFDFLAALQLYQDGHYLAPEPTVTLCFGEELNDYSTVKSKLIIVEVISVKYIQYTNMTNLIYSFLTFVIFNQAFF